MKDGHIVPQEITLFLTVSLMILLAVWSYQMISYRQQLTAINKEQIEDCFYLDCTADFFGNLDCRQVEMYDNTIPVPAGAKEE